MENPFERGTDAAVGGCAIVVAIVTFLPWFRVDLAGTGIEAFQANLTGRGIDTTKGVVALIASLATLGLLAAERMDVISWNARQRSFALLVTGAVAALMLAMAVLSGDSVQTPMFEVRRTAWPYVGLLSSGGVLWFSYLRSVEAARGSSSSAGTDEPD